MIEVRGSNHFGIEKPVAYGLLLSDNARLVKFSVEDRGTVRYLQQPVAPSSHRLSQREILLFSKRLCSKHADNVSLSMLAV